MQSDRIARRTFEATQHPKGSAERRRLNESAETSEYMPSHRYVLITATGHVSFRTRREAELHAAIVAGR